jgi:hypothetical protein
MDEATILHPGRGRGRKREGPAILVNNAGHRVVKTKRGAYVRVENYAVVNTRTMEEVIGRMTQPELRRCIDLESASPTRRQKMLIRLTHVLCTLERTEKINLIKQTVPVQPAGARRHTVPMIEAAALRTFGVSTKGASKGRQRRAGGSSYRSVLTARMKRRKAEFEQAAAEQVRLHGPLSRRDRDRLRQNAGDHFEQGNPCRVCGAVSHQE